VLDAHGADQVGVLVAPTATLEEMNLLQAVARGLGVHNIDHRLRQADFSDQDTAPLCPTLGQPLAALETLNAALVIGANPRKDQPLAGHRLRKAALAGAQLMFVNPIDYEFLFDVHAKAIVPPSRMVAAVAGIAACFPDAASSAADAVRAVISKASPDAAQRAMATALKEAGSASVLLGNAASAHPQYSLLKALAGVIATASGASLGILPDAANSVGGWLAGAVPHRGPAGSSVTAGLDARAMLDAPRKGYLLFGVEPAHDCWNPAQAVAAIDSAEFVVSISPYASDAIKASADVLLPVGPFTETSGTFVNAEGRWQSFAGVASPVGDSRPGWKVLRVLGNQFGLDGFEQTSSEEVRDALRARTGTVAQDNSQAAGAVAAAPQIEGLERIGDVAIYALDAVVRRAPSLQATPDALAAARVRLNAAQAEKSGVSDGDTVKLTQGSASVGMDVALDARVPDGCLWVQAGTQQAAALADSFGPITIARI
jgi:NADH-quinone oxidoreductase subunit G